MQRAGGLFLSILAAGCGKTPGITPDAEPTGEVTVTVYAGLGEAADPVAIGATVLFHDHHGALVAEATTDAAGQAQAVVAAGASVTVVRPGLDGTSLTTILDVAPGDALAFGRRRYYEWVDEERQTFTLPAAAGASSYAVYAPCTQATTGGADTQTVAVTFNDRCADEVPVVAVAFAGLTPDSTPLGAIYLPAVARDGASVDVSTSATWTPVETLTVAFTGVPAEVTRLDAFAGLVLDGLGRYARYADVVLDGGTVGFTAPVPLAPGELQLDVRLQQDAAHGAMRQTRRGPATSSYTIAVDAELGPWLAQPSFDPAQGEFAVASAGAGTAQAIAFDAGYAHDGETYAWRVYAPGEVRRVTLPTLPDRLASAAPRAGDTPVAHARALRVGGVEGAPLGYAELRGDLDRNLDVGFEPWLRRGDIAWVTQSHDPDTTPYPEYFPE